MGGRMDGDERAKASMHTESTMDPLFQSDWMNTSLASEVRWWLCCSLYTKASGLAAHRARKLKSRLESCRSRHRTREKLGVKEKMVYMYRAAQLQKT